MCAYCQMVCAWSRAGEDEGVEGSKSWRKWLPRVPPLYLSLQKKNPTRSVASPFYWFLGLLVFGLRKVGKRKKISVSNGNSLDASSSLLTLWGSLMCKTCEMQLRHVCPEKRKCNTCMEVVKNSTILGAFASSWSIYDLLCRAGHAMVLWLCLKRENMMP